MVEVGDDFSDFDDDDLDSLYQKNINKTVQETVIRTNIPVQRDLNNNILPGQKTFYEEIQREVTFGPSHHAFHEEELTRYIYPTNFEIRDYQFTIVKKALLTNVLCAIPTGMGKTFIASTVMLNFFRWTTTGKVIFMAPTRPLVAQQIKACLGVSGIPSDQTAILLDKSRKNRESIWQEKRVFFTTPQVVENDLKRGVLNPKDVVCLVVDEAHRATGAYAYTNVVQFINRFNSSYRVLALTATPGSDLESVQAVVNNLNISKIEIRTEESMDIVKYMKKKQKEKIQVPLTTEIEDIIEQLGIAITPTLQQAVELGIYEECEPSRINAFTAMQQSKKLILNPSIPEGIKWRNFFILQLLNHFGQMLKRIKIYGIRTFFNYFKNKFAEFTTKYSLGKSTNKVAASFYYHPILKNMMKDCERQLNDPNFLGHGKLEKVRDELNLFFSEGETGSRVIIFTELRESALEIVKCIDSMNSPRIRPHIFIGQARGKEGFDEVEFTRKHKPKGRKKVDRLKRQEEEQKQNDDKKNKKEKEKLERTGRRTASSEEAQINGMNQKQQKEVIQRFKQGEYNVLVCTSIGEEGLDIGEVDCIICYDTTSSPIKNIQRMGRTGRKRDGHIVLLFSANESHKFEQAMEDYIKLQKLIAQNYVEYHKSDRILPQNIDLECEKKYMTIANSDENVNEMEDTEEVIRYATQCMMGKTPKPKKKATKKPTKAKEKQFFMPDNVDGGIISASNLVNKFVTDDLGEISLINKDLVKKEPKRSLNMLDRIENDSSSSGISDAEEASNNNKRRKKVTESISKEKVNVTKPTVVKKENVRGLPKSSDIVAKGTNKVEIQPSSKINPVKEEIIDDFFFSTTEIPKRSKDGKLIIDVSTYKGEQGYLSKEEKDYFRKNYLPDASLSMELIPNFHINSRNAVVKHSNFNKQLLKLFSDLRYNVKERIIDMNRTNCVAKVIQNKNSTPDTSFNNNTLDTSMGNNSIQASDRTETSDDVTNEDVLDDILGSDSDF